MSQGHGNKYREYLEAGRDFSLGEGMISWEQISHIVLGEFFIPALQYTQAL